MHDPYFFSIEGNMHIGFKASVAIRATTIFFWFFSCENERMNRTSLCHFFLKESASTREKIAQKSAFS
jgi:hypothetical protein